LTDPEITIQEQVGRSIRVVSRVTGFSIDTLRMWERRYGFPSPLRSGNGNRIYSESDVKRLQLVSRALKMGYRVSDAIRLDESTLVELLASPAPPVPNTHRESEDVVEQLLGLLRANDVEELTRSVRRYSALYGAGQFIAKVVAPILNATGKAWSEGRLAIYQEHLLTSVISSELTCIASRLDNVEGPIVLFATFPRERHGLGLQMVATYCQLFGVRPYVLGTELPLSEMVLATTALRAQAVAVSASINAPAHAVHDHVLVLARDLPENVGIWLGGTGANSLENMPPRVQHLGTWDALELAVSGLIRGL
jgi:DNA-binding transcriptional MerR regulator